MHVRVFLCVCVCVCIQHRKKSQTESKVSTKIRNARRAINKSQLEEIKQKKEEQTALKKRFQEQREERETQLLVSVSDS